MPDNLLNVNTAVSVGVVLVALVLIGFVYMGLYRRTAKTTAIELAGQDDRQGTMSHGAVAPPVLSDKTAPVDADILKLEVVCQGGRRLITLDRKHVDMAATFLMRAKQTVETVSSIAQTLEMKTADARQLKVLFEDKFIDALRTTAATTTMKALQDNRGGFAQAVQEVAAKGVGQNGLDLESVVLTRLEPAAECFNQDRTSGVQARRTQSLETDYPKPDSSKQQEYAMFEQQKTTNATQSVQDPMIVKTEAERQRESEHPNGIAPAERHQAWEKAGIATSRISLTESAGTEAEGIAAVHDAKNRMGAAQIDLAVRMQLIQSLPGIVTQALTPTMGQDGSTRTSQPYQVVKSIVDAIMKDAGLSNPSLGDIVQIVAQVVAPARGVRGSSA